MRLQKMISLHPLLAAGLDMFAGLFLLWWMSTIAVPATLGLWWLIRGLWWFILTQAMYYPPRISAWRHLASMLLFNSGMVFFLIFIDGVIFWYGLAFLSIVIPVISFALVPAREGELSVMTKPHRRWRFLMSVFGVAGLLSGASALVIYQVIIGAWALALWCSVILLIVGVSVWWWREYSLSFRTDFFVATGVLLVLLSELAYVVSLWPTGYLVNGFFITWLWYVLWLLLRFSLTAEGIDWKKQRLFFIMNSVFMIIFLLFIVRWK